MISFAFPALFPFLPLLFKADVSAFLSKSGEESRFLLDERFEDPLIANSAFGTTVDVSEDPLICELALSFDSSTSAGTLGSWVDTIVCCGLLEY